MNSEELLKKLTEIKEEVYNNVHSSDKKSPLQVESATEFSIEEDAAGEEVKIERTKGEKVKEIKTLSRATSMGPNTPGADKSVYITDGSTKKSVPTLLELQYKLDLLKFSGDIGTIDVDALKNALRSTIDKATEQLENLLDMGEQADVEQIMDLKQLIKDMETALYKSVKKMTQ
jgi:hypothetical protein